MSSTGADTSKGTAFKREHNQGRQDRSYTPEQHAAVKRVLSCEVTDFYEILSIKRDCTEAEIRKSYRKLALVMHPDKNGAPQADEAFKRVSKAFQILSDGEKRRIYDQTGSDPEQRGGMPGGAAAATGAQFAGGQFAGTPFDPEEIFQAFFGPRGGFGQSPFGNAGFGSPYGAQFAFGNGGPRVFTFNGNPFAQFQAHARQQAQRRQARGGNEEEQRQQSYVQLFFQFLPLILLLIPYILSFFSLGDSAPSIPRFQFERQPPYVKERRTPRFKIPFYVNPKDMEKLSKTKLKRLDREAETRYVSNLRVQCNREHSVQEQKLSDATGWFKRDEEKYQAALNYPKPHCTKLDNLGLLI